MDFSQCARLSRNVVDKTKNPAGSQLDELKGLSLSQWEKATAHAPECQQSLDALMVKVQDAQDNGAAPSESPAPLLPQPR